MLFNFVLFWAPKLSLGRITFPPVQLGRGLYDLFKRLGGTLILTRLLLPLFLGGCLLIADTSLALNWRFLFINFLITLRGHRTAGIIKDLLHKLFLL